MLTVDTSNAEDELALTDGGAEGDVLLGSGGLLGRGHLDCGLLVVWGRKEDWNSEELDRKKFSRGTDLVVEPCEFRSGENWQENMQPETAMPQWD